MKTWLKAGETVELRGELCLAGSFDHSRKPVASPVEWPDFEARLKAIFGDRSSPQWKT